MLPVRDDEGAVTGAVWIARDVTDGHRLAERESLDEEARRHGKEIARATSAQRGNKLWQQPGRKRFNAGVELDVRFGSHTLSAHNPPSFRLALAHPRP